MSMVPSEAYFDGDPEGERADQVVSGFIVSVMMFALATGFAVVAFFALQQMRGGAAVATASEVLSRVARAPTIAEEPSSMETGAISAESSPAPIAQIASDDDGASNSDAGDVAGAGPSPVPTIKPTRTRPPTVTFDSSILDDPGPPAIAASSDAPASAPIAPSVAAPVENAVANEIAPAEETPAPAPSARPEPTRQETAPAEPALPDPPVLAQTQEAQTPPAVATAPDAAPDALSGAYLVQVGSFRSSDEAAADWRRIERRFSTLLAGKTRHVATADLGDRGVFYRLRIGPFGSVEDARAHCQALKAGGQDCLAVRQ